MEKRKQNLEALTQQVLAAHEKGWFSPELIRAIGVHCRHRRAEGRTPGYIAEELGISEWQVADWIYGMPRDQPAREEADEPWSPRMFELKLPLTSRLERLLVREFARAMQHCDSCCWRKLVDSLPGHFQAEKAGEQP